MSLLYSLWKVRLKGIPDFKPILAHAVDKSQIKLPRFHGILLNDLQDSGHGSLDSHPRNRILEFLLEGKVNVLLIYDNVCENDSLFEDCSF